MTQLERLAAAAKRTELEDTLATQIKQMGLPNPCREYRWLLSRAYRFDFAYPDRRVAAEVEGGIWIGGRHIRPSGFIADTRKYNTAAAAGWLVFRFVPEDIKTGVAVGILAAVLNDPTIGR